MKTLIEKEIRLLLPAFGAAVALAVFPVWLLPVDRLNPGAIPGFFFFFGVLLLGLSTFGRELGLRTLPFLLAQPLERSRIWWTKAAVLGVFTVLVFDVWWLSGNLRAIMNPPLRGMPELLEFSAVTVATYVAGGLWLTLLLRQVAGAFWLSILAPFVLVMPIQALGAKDSVVLMALGVYSVTAFFLARWQFLHLQDTTWTGGNVTLGCGQTIEAGYVLRARTPWVSLFRKELRLQELTLAGIAGLFVVHLGVVALRKAGADVFSKATLSTLQMFGVVWLFVPLLAGSQSVAEERQLGTLDALLCLPVSRRAQFAIKMLFVIVLGGILSPALLCVAERIGSAIGAGANLGVMNIDFRWPGAERVFYIFMALSLVGYYASTLTRSVVQAMAAGAGAVFFFWMILHFAVQPVGHVAFGWRLWPAMTFPAVAVAIIWLGYGNFRWLFESGRRWRRNILVLTGVIVLVSGSAAAVYHRVWEFAMPLEVAPGPARLPAGEPVKLCSHGGDVVTALLPDGRMWIGHIAYGYKPGSSGGYVAPGTNWADVVLLFREKVAIRSDGTLWVSESQGWQDRLTQFGQATDWKGIAQYGGSSVILLKRDGSLWHWGTNSFDKAHPNLGLRNSALVRLGGENDWDRILQGQNIVYAWKQDGAAWALHFPEPNQNWGDFREPDLDGLHFRSMITMGPAIGIRDDGTMWWHINYWRGRTGSKLGTNGGAAFEPPTAQLKQVGGNSKWISVSADARGEWLAVKNDGSLWKWKPSQGQGWMEALLNEAPVRLGTRTDWISVGNMMYGSLALAADGTLWEWPRTDLPPGFQYDSGEWLAPSRRPGPIANIFANGE